jgi:hypothetical protein
MAKSDLGIRSLEQLLTYASLSKATPRLKREGIDRKAPVLPCMRHTAQYEKHVKPITTKWTPWTKPFPDGNSSTFQCFRMNFNNNRMAA